MQPAVFAFPCATLITMVLALIMYLTLRHATHQKDMMEVGARGAGPGPLGPERMRTQRVCERARGPGRRAWEGFGQRREAPGLGQTCLRGIHGPGVGFFPSSLPPVLTPWW